MARKTAAQKRAKALKEAAEQLKSKSGSEESIKPLPLDIEDLKEELRNEEKNSEDDSDSEEEDEYGELLTEDVENGLNKVLNAIKTGDKTLFDSSVNFFENNDDNGNDNGNSKDSTKDKEKNSKPIYLKDYHRQALLSNDNEESIEKPYVQQQKEDKEKLIKEIHNALGSDDENDNKSDDDDDDFLVKKEKKQEDDNKVPSIINLPDPEKEGKEKFLEAFMENHAWLPIKGKPVEIENEDDSDFENAAEKFENAYNFRYEDPKSTEIVSYARSQATMRREKINSRKRERMKQQEETKIEKEKINEELKKKKQKKVNLVMDRIKEIKEAVGDEISDEKIMQVFGDSLLKDDFDDSEWDAKMNEIFNDEYYAEDDKTLKKPEWDDDLDVDNYDDNDDDNEEIEEVEGEEEIEEQTEEKKSHKSKKKEEKYTQKQEKNKIKEVAERLVESKTLDILDQVQEEHGANKNKSQYKFKYREVSPESFGLTYNEIFKANDSDLNELIGLKKLAPYRPQEKAAKDKRRVTKSKNMREWRKRTFGSEKGISETENLDIKIPSIVFDNNSGSNNYNDGPKHKKRKSKTKTKSKSRSDKK